MRKQNVEIHSFKDYLRPDKIALMRSLAREELFKDNVGVFDLSRRCYTAPASRTTEGPSAFYQ